MRKLASIQKILDIKPIDGADKIEVCQVLGWKCVALKDTYNIGDKIVYIEIDSLIPLSNPNFEFLRENEMYSMP